MKELRWLFPFTHGVDMHAINHVVQLAGSLGATLVPVSLISVPHERRSKGARLEHIEQSKDFLEAVQHKAVRYGASVERYEVLSGDVIQGIATLVHELHCSSIVVVVTSEQQGIFLRPHEMEQLFKEPPAPLVLIRLPIPRRNVRTSHLGLR